MRLLNGPKLSCPTKLLQYVKPGFLAWFVSIWIFMPKSGIKMEVVRKHRPPFNTFNQPTFPFHVLSSFFGRGKATRKSFTYFLSTLVCFLAAHVLPCFILEESRRGENYENLDKAVGAADVKRVFLQDNFCCLKLFAPKLALNCCAWIIRFLWQPASQSVRVL